MVIGVGIDLVEVSRFEGAAHSSDHSDLTSLFSNDEIAYCSTKRYAGRHFAARFAAKEAFLKALGTGARTPGEFRLVEVLLDELGAPSLKLTGVVQERSVDKGVQSIQLSITHTETTAAAVVVLEG